MFVVDWMCDDGGDGGGGPDSKRALGACVRVQHKKQLDRFLSFSLHSAFLVPFLTLLFWRMDFSAVGAG